MKQCKRILIVEDDHAIREALKDVLEMEGYSTMTASNGKEGIEILRKSSHPCLVLLDLMMPVMTGWDFLEALKKDKRLLEKNPGFILSAVADKRSAEGVAGFLKKPMELDSVLSTVRNFCG